jgi:glycosyltransferase involved in cell wall biosynthesis
MQERKKMKIVIASVLKPVDETRMYDKLGKTFSQAEHTVTILGTTNDTIPSEKDIHFIPFKKTGRFSLSRIFRPIQILRKILQLKPDLVIITTHELLVWALLSKILVRHQLIYDVQENYYLNILYTKSFPLLFRFPIATYVRIKEILSEPFVNSFILAERIYADQLQFLKGRYILIENKVRQTMTVFSDKRIGYTKLVFTGTLAESTGVFDAIQIAKNLHALEPSVTLTIIGYSASCSIIRRIKETIQGHTFIDLIGGSNWVRHELIMNEIASADFGLVCYQPNKSTQGRIPTKYFEYEASNLPVLVTRNQTIQIPIVENIDGLWISQNESAVDILERMRLFKRKIRQNQTYTWEEQESLLLSIIK